MLADTFFDALRKADLPRNYNLAHEIIRRENEIRKGFLHGNAEEMRMAILLLRWEFVGSGLLSEDCAIIERIFGQAFGWEFNGRGIPYRGR